MLKDKDIEFIETLNELKFLYSSSHNGYIRLKLYDLFSDCKQEALIQCNDVNVKKIKAIVL